MSKTKRLNGYYVATTTQNRISISHQPRWLFYFANKEKFFRKRGDAYRKLAELLRDDECFTWADHVESSSFVIDFEREVEKAESIQPRPLDRSGFALIWFFNLYNWRISRFMKFLKHMALNRVSCLLVDRNTFVRAYLGGNRS